MHPAMPIHIATLKVRVNQVSNSKSQRVNITIYFSRHDACQEAKCVMMTRKYNSDEGAKVFKQTRKGRKMYSATNS